MPPLKTGLDFQVTARSGKARKAELQTLHGAISTPVFMPVGTAATVKAMLPESVAATGARIILANTYHLLIRPKLDLIQQLGGVRAMMGWDHALLTDSGGFQIMSLADRVVLDEQGARFRSPYDGSEMTLTPESVIAAQLAFDSTVTMVLDQCCRWPIDYFDAEKALAITHHWALRSLEAYPSRAGYGLFAIVQGSMFPDLRQRSVSFLSPLDFDGFAIGGLAVGEDTNQRLEMIDLVATCLPADKPRYAMGIGKPEDIIAAVALGVDMFDCVLPTRSGRTGQAFTANGPINLLNSRYRADSEPLEPDCPCPACRRYSRAYLRHLVANKEILAAMLLTWHNLSHYQRLMATLRSAIAENRFHQVSARLLNAYRQP